MHPLLERFTTRRQVRDVIVRGRRREGLDVFEQALWAIAQREERVVERLERSFDDDGDGFEGDAAADVLAVEAAASLLLGDLRLGEVARAAKAACLGAGLAEADVLGLLGAALEEEAFQRPSLPGHFDREWVREALESLARLATLGPRALERELHALSGDRAVVAKAMLAELHADDAVLVTWSVVARGLEACGDELAEPGREHEHARAFVERLAALGVVGPRRLEALRGAFEAAREVGHGRSSQAMS